MKRAFLWWMVWALAMLLSAAGGNRVQAQSGGAISVSNGWALPGGLDTLNIGVANSTAIKGLHFKLVDGPDKLTVTGMAKLSRIASFRVDTTSRAGGFWVLMVPDTSTSPRLAAGSGDILQVYVRVASSATGGTNASVGFDSVTAAANAAGNPPVSLAPRSGVFWFGRKGDVVYNGAVDLFDVLRMIDIALSRPPSPTAYERWASDFNENGSVDISDIGKAIDLAVSGTPKVAQVGENAPASFRGSVALHSGPSLDGYRLRVTVDVESPLPLAGLEMVLKAKDKDVAVGVPELTGLANGMSMASKIIGEDLHLLICSTAGLVMPAGRGTVAAIPVTVRGDEVGPIPLEITQAVGASVGGQAVELVWDESGSGPGEVPQSFALHQSRPNPFAATTVIGYEIPAQKTGAVEVKLAVYNVHGQLVRMLERTKRDAGRYVVQWDGRDDLGNAVSSGLYFCELVAGQVTLVRKLAVLR
ncbi:MAG: FlgD immunoglobulin-like domain containing protein [Candidatus Oleimicrobiaceae bacterium]